MRPTAHTDAYEDDTTTNPPMIFLAGPIKHWWTCWDSPEHRQYVEHRDFVRAILIHHGYLTYAPWEAIKGTWNPRAQAINNMAIAEADLLLSLGPVDVPADGTLAEIAYAGVHGTLSLSWPPSSPPISKLNWIRFNIGPGQSYE